MCPVPAKKVKTQATIGAMKVIMDGLALRIFSATTTMKVRPPADCRAAAAVTTATMMRRTSTGMGPADWRNPKTSTPSPKAATVPRPTPPRRAPK